jgi:hypothetical protein
MNEARDPMMTKKLADYMSINGEDALFHPQEALLLKKKKSGSKKTKRGWRKLTNIDDVEEYLEEKRKESIRFGEPIENVKSEQLFFVDHGPPPHPSGEKWSKKENIRSKIHGRTHQKQLKGKNSTIIVQFPKVLGGHLNPTFYDIVDLVERQLKLKDLVHDQLLISKSKITPVLSKKSKVKRQMSDMKRIVVNPMTQKQSSRYKEPTHVLRDLWTQEGN